MWNGLVEEEQGVRGVSMGKGGIGVFVMENNWRMRMELELYDDMWYWKYRMKDRSLGGLR